MTTASGAGFRESVRNAKERWNDGRQIMRRVHDEGAPGRQVVHAMSDLLDLSLIHISEPTRQAEISYAVFCLKKKK